MSAPRLALLTAVLAAALIAACSPTDGPPAADPMAVATVAPVASPSPPAATATLVPLAVPELYVAREPVALWSDGAEEGDPLFGGETVSTTVGTAVTVDMNGVAMLRWPGSLSAELLTGSDVTLEEFDAAARRVVIAQDDGIGRYLLRKGPAADIEVTAGPLVVVPAADGADFVVGYDDRARTWVAVMTGSATVSAGGREVRLAAEEAVGYSDDTGLTGATSVDPISVEVWYSARAAGTNARPISEVTFRCRVAAEPAADVRRAPRNGAATMTRLPAGTVVDGIGRDEGGEWVRIVLAGTMDEAWLPARVLDCNLAVAELPSATPVAVAGAGRPSPTPSLPAAAASRTATAVQVAAADGDGSRRRHGRSPDESVTAGPPTPTECVGPECETGAEPTETPRPPRTKQPTKVPATPRPTSPPPPTDRPDPTDDPRPTDVPPTPTVAPTPSSEPPTATGEAPTPTIAPATPSTEPPTPTDAPPQPTEEPTPADTPSAVPRP